MPQARKTIVHEGIPQVFHCVARCVRRAFLCGMDGYSGRDYEHRRGWVRDRLKELAGSFAVDIYSYAVMRNHLHVVLRTDAERAADWSAEEVVIRWRAIFPKQRDENGTAVALDGADLALAASDTATVELWRGRLASVSWLMRCLNEKIARRANREDDCKGRFWEGRFRCQRLDDAQALLACMVYVDLNPIRAGIAETIDGSEFTSAQDRVRAEVARGVLANAPKRPIKAQRRELALAVAEAGRDSWLTPIREVRLGGSSRVVDCGKGGKPRQEPNLAWRMGLDEYLVLMEASGRWRRGDKKGAIACDVAPVLERIGFQVEEWSRMIGGYASVFHRVAGRAETLAKAAANLGQRWVWGERKMRAMSEN